MRMHGLPFYVRAVHVAGVVLMAGVMQVRAADRYIGMGAGALLLGQPSVSIEVYTPDDPATTGINERITYGPELVLGTFAHSFLLDTGANSLLISRDPYADVIGQSNLEQMQAKGFQDAEGVYREQGVGGFTDYNVSAAYSMDFATDAGSTGSLSAVHFMSRDDEVLGDWSGIVGMPAMAGLVVTLDMTPWLAEDLSYMNTLCSTGVPPGSLPRYQVPLTMVPFPQDGQMAPGDPLPAWAPLPFLVVNAESSNHAAAGSFLLDTGAQLSMLSEHLAISLGLDSSGDGVLDSNDVRYVGSQEVQGVGGIVAVPLFEIDALEVDTLQDVALRWETAPALVLDEDLGEFVETNIAPTFLVLEITPEIDGVFGMDLIHSSWSEGALGGTTPGAMHAVHLDFRDITNLVAEMIIDLEPDIDRDGLPDAWEAEHFLGTAVASSGTDYDGDGFVESAEYGAGTVPTNATSLLRMAGPPMPTPAGLVVSWQAVTGKTYRVQSADAPNTVWTTEVAGVTGQGTHATATVDVVNASAMVRVEVEP